jgi:hypothetical protein
MTVLHERSAFRDFACLPVRVAGWTVGPAASALSQRAQRSRRCVSGERDLCIARGYDVRERRHAGATYGA